MPDAIWIDQHAALPPLASELASQEWIGVDTEFLRERTFYPKLCLLQLSAGRRVWCVDTLHSGSLEPLVAPLTAPATRKIIHSARQDLEAVYLTSKCVMSPVYDTQIAAGCTGLKPQMGYAELVKTLLDVTLPKGQTRTDWSKRPLSPEQLEYAADDVLYLGEIAALLAEKLRHLGREHWVLEDCLALADPRLYEPAPEQAWERLRGLNQLAPAPRARAKVIAIWRERESRQRDLPRSWVLSDAAIFGVAQSNPATLSALGDVQALPTTFNERLATGLLAALHDESACAVLDEMPSQDARPTTAQRTVIDRLAKVVDARAAELQVSAEILAPRGELKALGMGKSPEGTHALTGWRRAEIGQRLLAALP